MAYESKLQSSSLYWHAFRTLMHDSLLETQKSDLLVRGWTHTSEAYGRNMMSVGEWCMDDKGAPFTDAKKKKMLDAHNDNGGTTGGSVSSKFPTSISMHDKRGSFATANFYQEEKCGLIIHHLADSAGDVSMKYTDFVSFMNSDVIPQLSS